MASTKKAVLITGSTRGIGLAFVEHYVKAGWNVIATARGNSNRDKLAALSPFKIVTVDTADEASIIEAACLVTSSTFSCLLSVSNRQTTLEDGVAGLAKVIAEATPEDSG